ncbi:MAG: hypothetical protein ACOYW9_00235 [Deinococcota bacterium]
MRVWGLWALWLLLAWVSWPLGLLTLMAFGVVRILGRKGRADPILPPFLRSRDGFGPDQR